MKSFRNLCKLFLLMFKIGLFTFGGGYAMIALLEAEFVTKRAWLGKDEFLDLVAIAESTPGPIAINMATFLGYRRAGVPGSVFATLGVCLPSYIIIYVISLFFDQFLSLTLVACAFRGIQVCVIYLIGAAGIKMAKGLKKQPLPLLLMLLSAVCLVTLSLFSVSFSSVWYILIGGTVGLTVYGIDCARKKKEGRE